MFLITKLILELKFRHKILRFFGMYKDLPSEIEETFLFEMITYLEIKEISFIVNNEEFYFSQLVQLNIVSEDSLDVKTVDSLSKKLKKFNPKVSIMK